MFDNDLEIALFVVGGLIGILHGLCIGICCGLLLSYATIPVLDNYLVNKTIDHHNDIELHSII